MVRCSLHPPSARPSEKLRAVHIHLTTRATQLRDHKPQNRHVADVLALKPIPDPDDSYLAEGRELPHPQLQT